MPIKLKPTVVYKKENDSAGFLFSLGDDSNKLIKVSGLVNEVVQKLCEGMDFNQIKEQILLNYEVEEAQFLKDMEGFTEKLKELDFLA